MTDSYSIKDKQDDPVPDFFLHENTPVQKFFLSWLIIYLLIKQDMPMSRETIVR